MGGKPNPGTPADKRKSSNKTSFGKKSSNKKRSRPKPAKTSYGKGNG
jgi:hypothetical protein